MRVAHCSDLHLDFLQSKEEVLTLANNLCTDAAVLCIAGDTLESKELEFAMNPNSGKHGQAQRYVQFFEILAAHYQAVLVIMGNHEHYNGNITDTYDIFYDFFRVFNLRNCYILENEFITVNDVRFYCGTGWTDMGSVHSDWYTKQVMNDFRLIRKAGYGKFTPNDARILHAEFLRLPWQVETADVILMHHAPSIQSIQDRYKDDPLSIAYYSKTFEEKLKAAKLPLPLTIIHGHTHYPVNYKLTDKITVVSNPRGYDYAPELFKIEVIDV